MKITIFYKPQGSYTWFFEHKEDLQDFLNTVWNMKTTIEKVIIEDWSK